MKSAIIELAKIISNEDKAVLDEVKNGYVCERDWKDEKEDFLYFVGELKGISENSLIRAQNILEWRN